MQKTTGRKQHKATGLWLTNVVKMNYFTSNSLSDTSIVY